MSICPGLVNAAAAVKAAKDCAEKKLDGECVTIGTKNLPKVPLIDVDRYVVFADHKTQSSTIELTNHGAKKAIIDVRFQDPNWVISSRKMAHNQLQLEAGQSTKMVLMRQGMGELQDSMITFNAYDAAPPWHQKPAADMISVYIRAKKR
jgi:hypothetical protein